MLNNKDVNLKIYNFGYFFCMVGRFCYLLIYFIVNDVSDGKVTCDIKAVTTEI